MDFIDNSGHIFSLPSYQEEPVGYEFEENKYIFWVDAPNTNVLSINNYYVKTINFLVYYDDIDGMKFDDLVNVEILLSSDKFWFIKPEDIQNGINNNLSINEIIDLSSSELISTLNNDDLIVITMNDDINHTESTRQKTAIIPIYIVSTSNDEGTWISNILIHISDKNDYDVVDEEYCPISIGGIYEEQNEILYVNGQNMGIQLPKELFKAVYQCSYVNDVFDEQLYNEKLREYLLNFMDIKGELGNYNSIQKSLEWFGYGDKITLSRLLRTDNEFKVQYVKDFFNLTTDILDSFKSFTNMALLSLTIKENEETVQLYGQDFNSFFWGENKPYLTDISTSVIPVECGIGNDKWTYYKPYYDYSLYEIGLKLSCLKYYYQRYFLPIHLKIHSASITHKVFMNDVKFNNYVYKSIISERPIEITDTNRVIFDNNHIKYFTNQTHYVDDNFNEFNNYYKDDNKSYKIHDVCLSIPIQFINDKINKEDIPTYFNCVLLLEKEKTIDEEKLQYDLLIKSPYNVFYYNLDLYDKDTKNIIDLSKYFFRYKENSSDEWSQYILGYNNFKDFIKENYTKPYTQKISSFNVDELIDNQDIKDLLELYITDGKIDQLEYIPIEINNKNYYIYISSENEEEQQIIIIPKLYIEFKFDKSEIYSGMLISIHNSQIYINLKDTIQITYNNYTSLVYESHFSFIQNGGEEDRYKNFILYPKIMNNKNINYYINQNYTLRLLVNNRWYEYKFTSKLQDVYLDFGTIHYDYGNINSSKFAQLSDIGDDYVQFNSYLYEPNFVTINSIKYITDLEKYFINNSLDYIDQGILQYLTFNDHIEYNGHKIWFENSFFNQKHNIKINKEINDDIYIINENIIFKKIDKTTFNRLSLNDNDIITITNNSYNIFINDEQAEVYKNEVYKVISNDSIYQSYSDKINVSNNDKLLNKIYVYDLYKNGEKIKYEGINDENIVNENNPKININLGNIDLLCEYNESQDVIDLYKVFFSKNSDGKIIQNINIDDEYLHYDLYLMHDLYYLYIVFISKETLENDYSKSNKHKNIEPYGDYTFTYSSQSKQFLINRYKYFSKNGKNHFSKNDMIAARIYNMELPYNLYISSKWNIIPKSIGMNKQYNLTSNAEFTILSLPNNNVHQVGYYDVHVRYCIDNNVQHQIFKIGKIRIS